VEETFKTTVKDGVSSNFCQSLADLARDGDGIEVSLRWSMVKPEASPSSIRLSREDGQTLAEAAQRLSERESITDFRLHGLVTRIKEDPGAFDGELTVEGLVEGKLRRVRMTFDPTDEKVRDVLISAFKERTRIGVSGELTAHGLSLRLDRPRDLAAVPEADE
jgi:hypothetical protein